MKINLKAAVRCAMVGIAISSVASTASAAGAVASSTRLFTGASGSGNAGAASIGVAGTLTGGDSTTANSYTDDIGLSYSAWGHAGRWYNFELTSDVTTTIRVDGTTAGWAPGMTVYTSGASQFDLGTADFFEVGNNVGSNTPHNFNGTGNIGDFGTGWTTGPSGNMVATLGYANSGVGHHAGQTNWGEHIHAGAHTRDGAAIYSDGMTGSTGTGFAELTFSGLDAGWYTVFIGGADSAGGPGTFNVAVSTVPVPAAVWLMGTGIVGLLSISRRKTLGEA